MCFMESHILYDLIQYLKFKFYALSNRNRVYHGRNNLLKNKQTPETTIINAAIILNHRFSIYKTIKNLNNSNNDDDASSIADKVHVPKIAAVASFYMEIRLPITLFQTVKTS